MVEALLVNNPGGGWVESVFTFATQRLCGLDLMVVLRMKSPKNSFELRTAYPQYAERCKTVHRLPEDVALRVKLR